MANKLTKATASAMREQVVGDLQKIRRAVDASKDQSLDSALTRIETFCAMSVRVMAKTNLSKLRDELRTVEVAAHLAGRVVVD